MSWRDLGLCAEIDLDLWFPEKGEPAATAKRISRRCPVSGACLAAGMGERHGIWGGLTPGERLRLRHVSGVAA